MKKILLSIEIDEKGIVTVLDNIYDENCKLKFHTTEKAVDYVKELFDDENIRFCSECGKMMQEGYCVNGGDEYYCGDECLHKNWTPEEWEEHYEDLGDSYYTEWHDYLAFTRETAEKEFAANINK